MAFSAKIESSPIAGINVTPLVDVLLVLLIILMISAPVIVHENRMDLPASARASNDRSEPLRVTVDPGGMVFLNGTLVSDATLAMQLDIAASTTLDDAAKIPMSNSTPGMRGVIRRCGARAGAGEGARHHRYRFRIGLVCATWPRGECLADETPAFHLERWNRVRAP